MEAFARCVQQDTEIGEAWANIGAIHMKQRAYKHALHALKEASKHKVRDWRIQENLMMVRERGSVPHVTSFPPHVDSSPPPPGCLTLSLVVR